MVLGDRRVHDIVLWWPALMATLVVMLLVRRPVAPPLGPPWPPAAGSDRAPAGPVECEAMVPVVGRGPAS